MVLLNKLIAIALLGTLNAGCMIGYGIKSGYNQMKLMSQRQPINEILEDKKISIEQRRKLKLSLSARQFATETLKLKESENYTTFVELNSPYVTWAVQAAHYSELKGYFWNFPFVGKMPYKGYFNKTDALDEAKTFDSEKYDTFVRGVTAYSTLGWFNDPILSSMLSYQDHNLVNVIIHETVHATIYIKDHSSFNESLAVFLGNKGTELFYLEHEGQDSATYKLMQNEVHDSNAFSKFITHELDKLEKWYKAQKELSPNGTSKDYRIDEKTRAQRLQQIQEEFKTNLLPKLKTKNYHGFADRPLNNAVLLSYRTYYHDLEDFDALYNKLGKNFDKFLAHCKGLEKSKDPIASLKSFIAKN